MRNPIIEPSSLTEKINNALTASCDLKDEPVFSSLKQSFDEPPKRYHTKRSLSTCACQLPSEWATGPNTKVLEYVANDEFRQQGGCIEDHWKTRSLQQGRMNAKRSEVKQHSSFDSWETIYASTNWNRWPLTASDPGRCLIILTAPARANQEFRSSYINCAWISFKLHSTRAFNGVNLAWDRFPTLLSVIHPVSL